MHVRRDKELHCVNWMFILHDVFRIYGRSRVRVVVKTLYKTPLYNERKYRTDPLIFRSPFSFRSTSLRSVR